jgi:hypothetical protein
MLVLLFAALLTAAACGGDSAATGTADPGMSPIATIEPEPTTTTPPGATAVLPVTQTDTDWGRIWDSVPAGFPLPPGAVASEETGGGPVSATWTVAGTDGADLAEWMQSELELATYSTEALSGPLENGEYVLDSVGDDGCRMEVALTPRDGLTTVSVRFGAACPYE